MPSQNNEEAIILDFVKSHAEVTPNFLDVGAFDPVQLSNTRGLVELGWRGTYVEPAPDNFNRFLREYRDNDKITLVNAAVALTNPGLVQFHDSGGDALSTLVPEHVEKWRHFKVTFKPYLTRPITWPELFAAVGTNFGVLSLDVESLNRELFAALPLDQLENLRLIVVEHDSYEVEMLDLAKAHGYDRLGFNAENLILAR